MSEDNVPPPKQHGPSSPVKKKPKYHEVIESLYQSFHSLVRSSIDEISYKSLFRIELLKCFQDNILKQHFRQKKEVFREEIVVLARTGFGVNYKRRNLDLDTIRDIPSAAALASTTNRDISGGRNFICLFCDKKHPSQDCFMARKLTVDEKKNSLDKISSSGIPASVTEVLSSKTRLKSKEHISVTKKGLRLHMLIFHKKDHLFDRFDSWRTDAAHQEICNKETQYLLNEQLETSVILSVDSLESKLQIDESSSHREGYDGKLDVPRKKSSEYDNEVISSHHVKRSSASRYNETDHFSFENKCPVYKERLKEVKENETSVEEINKEKQQHKQIAPIQDDPQQVCEIITSNLKDHIQNIINVNETTKVETMYDRLCDNLSNNLKIHGEKLLREQLTIQIVDNSESATPTPSESNLLQTPEITTPQQKSWSTTIKKKQH
ncbi:hypothetical protein CDAR_220961 [Caerostris darwini]|uniref:Uncharacterized protein n=1 Tax=Caerostris darwini TaxID=1538125 RepID=A0AAV4MXR5_9ARAC|nr:hypothetical protein CDAR_220961 [Caerostris darwini]